MHPETACENKVELKSCRSLLYFFHLFVSVIVSFWKQLSNLAKTFHNININEKNIQPEADTGVENFAMLEEAVKLSTGMCWSVWGIANSPSVLEIILSFTISAAS